MALAAMVESAMNKGLRRFGRLILICASLSLPSFADIVDCVIIDRKQAGNLAGVSLVLY